MLQIWVRKEVVGPSSGTTIAAEVVVRREDSVWVDVLCEMREAVELRVDALPGIVDDPLLCYATESNGRGYIMSESRKVNKPERPKLGACGECGSAPLLHHPGE